MKKRFALLVTAGFLMTGCSSSNSATTAKVPPSGIGTTAPSAKGTTTTKPGATTAANPDKTLPDAPEPTDVVNDPDAGQAAPLNIVELNTPQEYAGGTMTVRKVACGQTRLNGAADNPKRDSSDNNAPKTVPATADAGSEFCRVDGTYKVSGKKPRAGWQDFGNLVSDDGTEYPEVGKAKMATTNLNLGLSGCAPNRCGKLNPGKQIPIVKIYQVPESTTPEFINYPSGADDSGTMFQFATR